MLKFIRKGVGSGFALLLIIPLILAFALWGVNDIFRGGTSDAVAKIGDFEIGSQELSREFRLQVRQLAQNSGGQIDSQIAIAFGEHNRVLERIINRTALDAKAAELGIATPDGTVRRTIQNDPSFQGAFGSFDRAIFQQQLVAAGLNENIYLDSVRGDLSRAQLLDSIESGVDAPKGYIDALFVHRQQKRKTKFLVLAPELAGTIPEPSDSELDAFYQANQSEFRTPEYRAFDFIHITAESLTSLVEVTDEDVKNQFEFARQSYETPETRDIEQIRFDNEEEAKQAAARLAEGERFLKVALDKGLTPDDIALGEVEQKDMDEAVGNVAFGLNAGDVSDPIEGAFGWFIVRVLSVTEGKSVTFEEVKDDIRKNLELDKAQGELYDIYNAIEDQLAGGATLEEVAEETNVTLNKVVAADPRGQDKAGKEVPSLANHPSITQEAFQKEIGDENYMQEAADGSYFVVEVKDTEGARIRDFEEVKDDVKQRWIASERRKKLQSLADNFAERGNNGEPFEAMGAEIDRAVTISPPVPRGGSNETFSRSLVDMIFEADMDQFVVGPVGIGESIVVAQVTEIIEPSLAESAEGVARLKIETSASMSNELITHYINDVRQSLGVETYPSMIERAVGAAN